MTRRARRRAVPVALAASALLALAVTTAAPASALGSLPPPGGAPVPPAPQPPPPPTPPSGPAGTTSAGNAPGGRGSSGTTQTGTVRNCSVYAGPSGFGASCVGGGGAGGPTTAQVLGGDPVPGCWDVALTGAELADFDTPDQAHFAYYWHTCLTGIDPTTKLPTGDGPRLVKTFTYRPVDAPDCPPAPGSGVPSDAAHPQDPALVCVLTLTGSQQRLVDAQGEQIPYPTVVPSPDPTKARVNQPVAFSVPPGQTEVGPITPGLGLGVRMRAVMRGLTVAPTGAGGPTLSCPAPFTGQAAAGDTPVSAPQLCWYAGYTRSSAGRQGGLGASGPDRYPVHAVATWVVQIDAGAGWVDYTAPFTEYQDTPLLVTQIQTLVVP